MLLYTVNLGKKLNRLNLPSFGKDMEELDLLYTAGWNID